MKAGIHCENLYLENKSLEASFSMQAPYCRDWGDFSLVADNLEAGMVKYKYKSADSAEQADDVFHFTSDWIQNVYEEQVYSYSNDIEFYFFSAKSV